MFLLFKHRSETSSEFPSSTHWTHWRFTKMVTDIGGQGVLRQGNRKLRVLTLKGLLFILKSPIQCLVYDGQLSFHPKTWHVMMWCVEGCKVAFFYHNRRFEVLQELEPIYNDECILLAVGLSRIARGEVVSFCVPAVFWWLLYTFIIFGNSSCIIFAVVRSTLLLLHFHLHSLFFRSYLVSLQYFDDFCSYAALVHVAFLLLCAVLCCFWAFICILCAFVISLCAHSILMMFFISSNNSCSIFALCVVLCWFCTCVCACCFFRTYLVSLPYFDGFYHIRQ